MESKLIGLVLIALLSGIGGGFGLGYTVYQPLNDNLSRELDSLSNKVEIVNSTLTNSLTAMKSMLTELNSTNQKTENKTWHSVMSFTANETSTVSPLFAVEGERWRIKWTFETEEVNTTDFSFSLPPSPPLWEIWHEINLTDTSWVGLVVYNENETVCSLSNIPIYRIAEDVAPPQQRAMWGGIHLLMAWKTSQSLSGIHDVFGEGKFKIAVKGVLTPVALTVESYH